MSQTELLMKEIESLPPHHLGEVIDFVGYLKHKIALIERDSGPDRYKAIEELEGLGKRMGSALTVDRFLEMRHEETEREETEYRHLFRHTGS
ncbi:MAG: DUF2281 domain-containing protein [Treponema sp.]|jgi:hypothetical protein|nr:DUF2281 domain-containing protein [Treponema sp.]